MHAAFSVHILTTGERNVSHLLSTLPHARLFWGSVGYDASCKRVLRKHKVRFGPRYYHNSMDSIEEGKIGLWCSQLRFAARCTKLCMLIEDDAVLSDTDVRRLYKSVQTPWPTTILKLAAYNTINVWNGSRTGALFDAVKQGIRNPADMTFESLNMYTFRGPIGSVKDPTHSAGTSLIRSPTLKKLIKLQDVNKDLSYI